MDFEWSQLYCPDCLDKGSAWLEFPDDLDDNSSKALRLIPNGAGIVNLTVRGIFHKWKNIRTFKTGIATS